MNSTFGSERVVLPERADAGHAAFYLEFGGGKQAHNRVKRGSLS
jgi:hypothetical protein